MVHLPNNGYQRIRFQFLRSSCWIRSDSRAIGAVLALGLALGGCATAPEARDAAPADVPSVDARPTDATLCDGTSGLRLLATTLSPAARVGPPDRVLRENGFYLLISGTCQFWVNAVDSPWHETRSGTLATNELSSVLAELQYGSWASLDGAHPPAPGDTDFDDMIFMDSTHRVVCSGGCAADGVPAEVQAMRDALPRLRRRLWETGVPVGGSVRLTVYEANRTDIDRYPASAWPAMTPRLDDIALTSAEAYFLEYGQGHRADDPDAELLRRLRNEYLSGARGDWWYHFIPIHHDGKLYELSLRDTTPFENERGLLTWLHD